MTITGIDTATQSLASDYGILGMCVLFLGFALCICVWYIVKEKSRHENNLKEQAQKNEVIIEKMITALEQNRSAVDKNTDSIKELILKR